MFDPDRNRMRQYYCAVFEKVRTGQPLEPLERLLADVIGAHTEYHALLTDIESALAAEYDRADANPFFHMSLHVALHEQFGTQRPANVLAVYQRLCQHFGDSHTAEHRMIECLSETLWEAQQRGTAPDEQAYAQRLQRLLP